jgi:hypothetical protein
MWFQTSAVAATRQFQLTRLYAELVAAEAIERGEAPELSSDTARRLAYRALGSYLAGAIVFPYTRFLTDAEAAALRHRGPATGLWRQLRAGGAPAGDAAQAGRNRRSLRLPAVRSGWPADQALSPPRPAPAERRSCLPALVHLRRFARPKAWCARWRNFPTARAICSLRKAQARRARRLRRSRRPYLDHARLRRAACRPDRLWRRSRSQRAAAGRAGRAQPAGSVRVATAPIGRKRHWPAAGARWPCGRRSCPGVSILAKPTEYALVFVRPIGRLVAKGGTWQSTC